MKKLISTIPYLLVAILMGVTVAYAGNLTPPGSPTKTMKSLSDLYQLINTGANTPSTDFTTPGTVSSTMNSLGDIYDLMTTKIATIDATKILTGTTIFGKAGSASVGGGLPKTGQNICYGTDASVIPCTGTGQDGETGGASSYIDHNNGTITDSATGLTWQKQDDGTHYTWLNALAYCNSNTPGLPGSGWRLPNIHELESIVDYNVHTNPTINSIFSNTQNYNYWSSTTSPVTGEQNFVVDVSFSTSNVYDVHKLFGDGAVRCVR